MKQDIKKASQSKQSKQCRSSRNGGSARMLSFEDRLKIAKREAIRSRYETIEYVCDIDGKSVFCTICDMKEACIVGLPEFIEVYYDGTVRSFQGFDYMDLIEDDLEAAELISKCRVFNGEDQIPEELPEDLHFIWKYERFWVENTINEDFSFGDLLTDYLNAGLREFEQTDDTPITLKAILYNRFCQHLEMTNAVEFRKWYVDYYQETSKHHVR